MQNPPRYNHHVIEKKWQKHWQDHKLFKAEVDRSKPKYYILDMFPYPSGAGLHVGHVTGYTATDIIARYKRQNGFNVLHPMGWDSFGLPAEQYAIRTGTHPAVSTKQNIDTYRRQLQSLGLSYDWDREVATSDPTYYKWTQWIFTKLYEKNLAYEAEIQVNFCPALGTVLANEEVENGLTKDGGYPVEKRPLRQWVLKITEYAEQLLDDLELLDWPDHLKRLQINWIGKSVGAEIDFEEVSTKSKISVFTTCPDTLFGVSYLVLAPEHPLVNRIVTTQQQGEVVKYQQDVLAKTDQERTDATKSKTGVWTGAFAVNPVTMKKVPIWISDYVLATYGTGAVMGVPAHDERDFEFARQYDLPVHPVIDPSLEEIEVIDGYTPQDIRVEVLAGKRCWTGPGLMINSETTSLTINGLDVPSAKAAVTTWLEKHHKGKKQITYKLRDWLFSRQRYWGEPFPILHFEDGTKRVLDVSELPLCPPELQDFKPSPEGLSPLARVKNWVEITDPKTGRKAFRETNIMPQWAGSCWYYLRFCDPNNPNAAWDKDIEQYWMPVDLYVGGVEHAVLHLLYARFWHKVLYDAGLVSTREPFQTLRNQGLVIAKSYKLPGGGFVPFEEVEEKNGKFYYIKTGQEVIAQVDKMSKSKLNGVSPDEIIDQYGADSLRLYEMFMGPFDKEKMWNQDAVSGCRRFLTRFHDMVFSDKVVGASDEKQLKLAHRLLDSVEKELALLGFNTSIARMMEFVNAMVPMESYCSEALQIATLVLAPFAPHLAEECWQQLGGKTSLSFTPFPKVKAEYLVDNTCTYVVQINGKMRGKWDLPSDLKEADLLEFVKTQPQIAKFLDLETVVEKVIFVPGKLLNIVVKN